ncbi:MAG: MoxR family ATPase [Lentisphaeraceae bacterium]|nr:MoxR family ATPase [Lentisphaeraceae bacterium]
MSELSGEEIVEKVKQAREKMVNELGKVIVGQNEILEQIAIAMFSKGHVLLMGVPGLGKTLLVKTIAQIFSLSYKRIQFTPDLMPADIFGTEVLEEEPGTGRHQFKFVKGPVFANIVLADEINRTPPKTQAALLEAMGEKHVTAGGTTYELDDPFFVLATQNPIELEGTYPLPEAQLDRFLFNIVIDYLSTEDEVRMVSETTSTKVPDINKIFDAQEIIEIQNIVRQVPVSENVVRYAVNLVSSTRPTAEKAPDFVKKHLRWGAGSRASQALILAGKARALLHGRYNVAIEDVKELAGPVLRHRIVTNFNADAEGITVEDIIKKLLDIIPE